MQFISCHLVCRYFSSLTLTNDDYKPIDEVDETYGKIDENPKPQLIYADIYQTHRFHIMFVVVVLSNTLDSL